MVEIEGLSAERLSGAHSPTPAAQREDGAASDRPRLHCSAEFNRAGIPAKNSPNSSRDSLRFRIGNEIFFTRVNLDHLDFALIFELIFALIEELGQAFIDIFAQLDELKTLYRSFLFASTATNTLELDF